MGNDRLHVGGAEFDEGALRPATVEELAAYERAASAKPSIQDRAKRPLLIAAATGLLLVTGAGALAIARSDDTPTAVRPQGSAAPFGVGYVDGFGEHSPKPTQTPGPRKPAKPISSSSPPSASPSGTGILVSATPTPTPSPTAEKPAAYCMACGKFS